MELVIVDINQHGMWLCHLKVLHMSQSGSPVRFAISQFQAPDFAYHFYGDHFLHSC
jgi:hypothetical protein